MILYPTETFYAIGIDPWNESARTKIYELKGRGASKELPCIAADTEMVQEFCNVAHPAFEVLTHRFWPGPLSLVLPLLNQASSIAVRVSSHPIAQQISGKLRSPLVSTSANLSGNAPIRDLERLSESFQTAISLAIDAGPTTGGLPSTIVSLLEDDPKILREGAIPSEQILAAL